MVEPRESIPDLDIYKDWLESILNDDVSRAKHILSKNYMQ